MLIINRELEVCYIIIPPWVLSILSLFNIMVNWSVSNALQHQFRDITLQSKSRKVMIDNDKC